MIRDDLRDQLDSMSALSELTSLRLQMAMDRRSKFVGQSVSQRSGSARVAPIRDSLLAATSLRHGAVHPAF